MSRWRSKTRSARSASIKRCSASSPVYRDADFVQAQTPGSRDVLVFERNDAAAGKTGGVAHFGFRLADPADIDAAAEAVVAAGGKIRDKGEFVPGEPYIFFSDPDGYEVEIWFEIPTPVDPKESIESIGSHAALASARRSS